jgi:hypothetical protein
VNKVTSYLLSGTFAFGVIAGVGRILARTYFRDTVLTSSHTYPCGKLVDRTSTTTRKTWRDELPKVEHVERRLDGPEGTITDDVGAFACGLGRGLAFVAVVASNDSPDAATIRILDASTGAVIARAHVDHAVDTLKTSTHADQVAAAGGADGARLSVVDVATGSATRVADGVLASSFTWSRKDELCWVGGKRPSADDGTAELWCFTDGKPRKITQAIWPRDATSSVWAEFTPSTGKPALCGRDLEPRDFDCSPAPP